jgi:uncharacterized membrane protein
MIKDKRKSVYRPALVRMGLKLFYNVIYILSSLVLTFSVLAILFLVVVGIMSFIGFILSAANQYLLFSLTSNEGSDINNADWSFFSSGLLTLCMLVVLAFFSGWITRAMVRKLTGNVVLADEGDEKQKNDTKSKLKNHE